MENNLKCSRRKIFKSSIFGLLAISTPNAIFAKTSKRIQLKDSVDENYFYRYPAIDDDIVSEVVGVSHFNLDRLKELVDQRPELSRASWDWAYGDWESALGAASHVGRKDITRYLLSKGARPDIFTFGMLGAYEVVKAMIEQSPGIQKTSGPHGFSLLRHVEVGSQSDVRLEDKPNYTKLIDYLKALGDADGQDEYLTLSEPEKSKYVGVYKYGEGEKDGFSIGLNMRKLLTLGKIGTFGGALYMTGKHKFVYNGCPSVIISFEEENNQITSITVKEPALEIMAKKVQ